MIQQPNPLDRSLPPTYSSIGMKSVLLAAACLAYLVVACVSLAMPPLPRSDLLGQAGQHYFGSRPPIIDKPQSPPTTALSGLSQALLILIDFDDNQAQAHVYTPEFFREKLFGEGAGTLRAYLEENSYGRFSLLGDVHGWFRCTCKYGDIVNRDGIAGTSDDYGVDTSSDAIDLSLCDFPLNVWGLAAHVAALADETVDFSLYDNDGPDGIPGSADDDGFVDALFVVHAGIGAENLPFGSENHIWSLQSNLDYYPPTRGTTVDGVRIGAFVIVPELGEIGVFAHEFCHLLGLPDLYNSETGNPVVGPLCLMDIGAWNGPQYSVGSVPSHLCAPMKYLLGWIEPRRVCLGCEAEESIEGGEIAPVGSNAVAYEVLTNPGGMDWSNDGKGAGEYFMLENRQQGIGYFESYIPASGLLIWKVDESRPNNNDSAKRLVEIIQADGETLVPGLPGVNLPGEPSDFWPGSLGKSDFTPYTKPPSDLAGGRFSGVAVENIYQLPTRSIRADISLGLPKKGPAYVFPNPYRPGDGSDLRIVFVPEPGPDTPLTFAVTIFDLEGNLVRRLEAGDELLDNGTALWDGKDESGKYVDMGLYLYVIDSSGQQATGLIGIKR
jgi:immune inhibitor A